MKQDKTSDNMDWDRCKLSLKKNFRKAISQDLYFSKIEHVYNRTNKNQKIKK